MYEASLVQSVKCPEQAGAISIGHQVFMECLTLPFWTMSSTPLCTKRRAACLVASIRGLQLSGCTFLGASLGQHVAPSLRFCSISRIICSSCLSVDSPCWALTVALCDRIQGVSRT